MNHRVDAIKPPDSARQRGPAPWYVGRFAPSPSGALHFGSLVSAVVSYVQARQAGGRWQVRIEDIDPGRERPGVSDAILRALEHFGMGWDGAVVYQSQRRDRYAQALARLERSGGVYPCACSRQDIARHGDTVYPGTCRAGLAPGRRARSVRLRSAGSPVTFEDVIRGGVVQDVEREVGDFIVRRADGWPAYHLAVVVDDAAQHVTEVVRGSDLLASTARQIFLQRLLGLPTPTYAHHPVVIDAAGRKLSKHEGARPLGDEPPVPALKRAWVFLGQPAAPEFGEGEVDGFWAWAKEHWRLGRVPRQG